MLQQETPEDYVLATGETTSVRDFITMAFNEVDIKMKWEGTGVDEKGINAETGDILIEIDPNYFRPTEVDLLIGDASKAFNNLGWKPKHNLQDLIKDMIQSDVNLFKRDKYLLEGGHDVMNYNE
jgi:GDPmannose 4,6-dehydratase